MNHNQQAEQQQQKIPARRALLEEALRITSHDRNSAYGNPEDNFQNIANYWNTYLTTMPGQGKILVLSSQDVAHLMILMKMARLNTNPSHRDSLVDIAGYAACGEDCRVMRSEPVAITGFVQQGKQVDHHSNSGDLLRSMSNDRIGS
jgi:hypothetical protein